MVVTTMEEKYSFCYLFLDLVLVLFVYSFHIGSIFQGLSTTVWQLIGWRLVTGLFAGSPIITQAYYLTQLLI